MVRKTLFWVHLLCGLIAGVVVGIMSFTGAALAFEKEIVAWAEREVRQVTPPTPEAKGLPMEEIMRRAREARPDMRVGSVTVANDPTTAIVLAEGGRGGTTLYVNPYTGDVAEGSAVRTRAFLRTMNAWHRWLGVEGEHRDLARAVTGATNFAFLVLAVTGLYLWWPRAWTAKVLRAVALLSFRARGKARDFNWHNALGLWSAPILIVLTATALPMSYHWADTALYRMTGSEPPTRGPGAGGGGPGGAAQAPRVSPPTEGAKRLGLGELLARVQHDNPRWEQISIRVGEAGERGAGAGRPPRGEGAGNRPPRGDGERRGGEQGERRGSAERSGGGAGPGIAATAFTLKERGSWPRTATTTLFLDPFTGDTVRREGFHDLPAGRQLRTWTRFLHTGEALGGIGQLLAGLASLGSLILIYTGFALAWRRFVPKRAKQTMATATT